MKKTKQKKKKKKKKKKHLYDTFYCIDVFKYLYFVFYKHLSPGLNRWTFIVYDHVKIRYLKAKKTTLNWHANDKSKET